jgi:hypothetical protein
MSNQASTPIVLAPIAIPPEYALPFMQMGQRPAHKFKVHDGARRRFHDRAQRAATLVTIQGGKENQ